MEKDVIDVKLEEKDGNEYKLTSDCGIKGTITIPEVEVITDNLEVQKLFDADVFAKLEDQTFFEIRIKLPTPVTIHLSNRYDGQYDGQVVQIDPENHLRVKVRVAIFDGLPVDDLPWAETLTPCQVDDSVRVDFPYGGDSRRPRIVGSDTSEGGDHHA